MNPGCDDAEARNHPSVLRLFGGPWSLRGPGAAMLRSAHEVPEKRVVLAGVFANLLLGVVPHLLTGTGGRYRLAGWTEYFRRDLAV